MKISDFVAVLIVTVAGSNEGAAQWSLGATKPDKTGQRSFLATLYAVGDGRDSKRLERLFVRCHQNRIEVVALLGWPGRWWDDPCLRRIRRSFGRRD
jgi:hypothetical protein